MGETVFSRDRVKFGSELGIDICIWVRRTGICVDRFGKHNVGRDEYHE